MTIVGMGLTGLSCARYLVEQGVSFRVVDTRVNPPLKSIFETEFSNVELFCGDIKGELFGRHDCLVVSPGLAIDQGFVKEAVDNGATISSDIQIFLEHNKCPVIAITGSNGKSTVTTLVGEMIANAGFSVCVAGNIGVPVLQTLVDKKQYDVYVLELSSFQLERIEQLNALASTVLNISEDHMDRYDSLNSYTDAKKKIYHGASTVLVNRDDSATHCDDAKVAQLSFGFSSPTNNEYGLKIVDGVESIFFGNTHIVDVSHLLLKGRHNIANVMASIALVRCLDIGWDVIRKTLSEFKGLRHRCEWVASVNGVNFYNDSKATNVGAAIAAISGFKDEQGKLLLIAGGKDKDSDFSEFAQVIKDHVSHVFLIGVDAYKIKKALVDWPVTECGTMKEAVCLSSEKADSGDVVLLAPACASFDMFNNYEHRGDVFCAEVRELQSA